MKCTITLDLKRNVTIDLFLLDLYLLTPFIVNKHIEGKVDLVAFWKKYQLHI